MDIAALKIELTTDPLGLGYAGMNSTVAAAKLNEVPAAASVGRQVEREIVPAWEVFEATAPAEWTALSATEKQRYQTILAMGSVNVKRTNTRNALATMFGAGTATRADLIKLQNMPASRATVLFGETVNYWDVERARI